MSALKKASSLPFVPASANDAEQFARATDAVLQQARESGYAGVGTLAEKPMHAILKHYLCADEDYHEVGVLDTDYVSDVRVGDVVYEVQSGSVFPMQKKIGHYLNKTDCSVVVVHPMVWGGTLIRLDPSSGELLSKKKYALREKPLWFLADLYPLRAFLANERLSFRLLFVEIEDYRLPHVGRGRREKLERIPTRLLGEVTLATAADYAALIPKELPSSFAAKEFAAATRLRGRGVYSILHVLSAAGALKEEKDEKGHFIFTRL